MSDEELEMLVDGWIVYWEQKDAVRSTECRPEADPTLLTPAARVMDLRSDEDHASLWRFVLSAYQRKLSIRLISILAAGPLEDLYR